MPAQLLSDEATIGIPCPGCGRETRRTIGWLRAHDKLDCDGCGRTVAVESSRIVEAIDRARETVIGILQRKV